MILLYMLFARIVLLYVAVIVLYFFPMPGRHEETPVEILHEDMRDKKERKL